MAKILISGGSGLTGQAISRLLADQGHEPRWLSREEGSLNGIQKFRWNVSKGTIDERAFEGVDYVIHLAGAGVMARRWNASYKAEILSSRIRSSELLFDTISRHGFPVKALAGAGAVGYYGNHASDELYTEASPPGEDFLARVCLDWENSYQPFIRSGIRTVVLRTGIVLSASGGAYPRMLPLFKAGLGSALGSGRQYFPWIHLNDLAAIYSYALEQESLSGTYNAVSSQPVRQDVFSSQLAKSLNKSFFMPPVPGFLLRLVLGESASALTSGLRISNEKIRDTGFHFRYDSLNTALEALKHGDQ